MFDEKSPSKIIVSNNSPPFFLMYRVTLLMRDGMVGRNSNVNGKSFCVMVTLAGG